MIPRMFIVLKLQSHYHFTKGLFHRLYFKRQLNEHFTRATSRAEFREMTATVFRQEKTYSAIVQDVFNASSTIKILRLHVKEPGFSFKAGQWIDFSVPDIPEVTGYSMTSAPTEAKKNGILELAVKYGKFPTTHWLHTSCRGGEEVQIRVGGDFYYDPQPNTTEATADLLLVGGGVGINPMVSILCEYSDLMHAQHQNISPGKVILLYSAKTVDELVFKETFTLLEKEHPTLTCQYFVTRLQEKITVPNIKHSRIEEADVVSSIKKLQSGNTLCYICGPSDMTDDVTNWLIKLGINTDYIRYEKWW